MVGTGEKERALRRVYEHSTAVRTSLIWGTTLAAYQFRQVATARRINIRRGYARLSPKTCIL